MVVKRKSKRQILGLEESKSPIDKLTQVTQPIPESERMSKEKPKDASKSITFSKDGVNVGGVQMSREEYNAFLKKKGSSKGVGGESPLTPNVQKALDIDKRVGFEQQAERNLKEADIKDEAVANVIKNRGTTPSEEEQTALIDSLQAEPQSAQAQAIGGIGQAISEGTGIPRNAAIEQGVVDIGGGALQIAALAVDSIGGAFGFSMKRSAAVQVRESTVQNTLSALDKSIELAGTGAISTSALNMELDRAEKQINEFERVTKGEGMLNLRYWLDEGAELESDVIKYKTALAEKRANLKAIEINSLVNRMRI